MRRHGATRPCPVEPARSDPHVRTHCTSSSATHASGMGSQRLEPADPSRRRGGQALDMCGSSAVPRTEVTARKSPGDPARGEVGPKQQPHHWTEAQPRRVADEVQAQRAALERVIEHGSAGQGRDALAQRRVKQRQSIQIRSISVPGHHLCHSQLLRPLRTLKFLDVRVLPHARAPPQRPPAAHNPGAQPAGSPWRRVQPGHPAPQDDRTRRAAALHQRQHTSTPAARQRSRAQRWPRLASTPTPSCSLDRLRAGYSPRTK